MSGAERPDFRAAAAEPDVCQLLREQLVEVIASIHLQAAIMQGLALEDPDERPVTRLDSRSST
jgi:hypothetical protein